MMCIIKQGHKLELCFSLESCTYSTTLKGGEEKGYCSETLTRVVQGSVVKLSAGMDIF